jgi:hypothetical protein
MTLILRAIDYRLKLIADYAVYSANKAETSYCFAANKEK